MAIIQNIEDLMVWQKAHQLTLKIYQYTNSLPDFEKFGLVSQMRRCAISIPSNIAEGFRRKGRDKFQFYSYSLGSLEELKYQILLCFDLKYISDQVYNELIDLCNQIGKMLNCWIKSLK